MTAARKPLDAPEAPGAPAAPAAPAARDAAEAPAGDVAVVAGVNMPALHGMAVLDDPLETDRFTRWERSGDGSLRVGISSLQLSGMHCAACTGIIEEALCRVPGVLEARVNPASQRASVHWDPARTQASALIAAVHQAGYGAVPDGAAPARELRRQEHRAAVWRLFVASFLAMQVMMMATPSYVAGEGDLAPDLASLLNWGSWVLSLPVLWFAGLPFLQGAWASLRARRIGMDVPVALGIVVTFVASSGATFDPHGIFGREVYFDSLTMFIAFLWLGRWLELRARHRAAEGLEGALAAMPETAQRVREDGGLDDVPVGRLQPGDRLRVALGAPVPADGALLSDAAGVGEALLTGESRPVAKRRGDTLLAGSVNLAAPLDMLVERVGADTRHQAIVALMREALSERPAAVRLADRIAGPFLWAVLALAAAAALAWLQIEPARAVWVAVSVLIVTCPCALSLATPATLVAAAGGLARRGVLLRHLGALETWNRVQTVFFDKTGTLTEDQPLLERVEPVVPPVCGSAITPDGGPEGADRALRMAASLAAWSRHPLSMALVDAARGLGTGPGEAAEGAAPSSAGDGLFDEPLPASGAGWQVDETPGAGIQATSPSGVVWRLGSVGWAGGGGPADAGACLSRQGQAVALFHFGERLREGVAQTLAELRRRGLEPVLLSGDAPSRAGQLARQLGIERVVAGASPEDKLRTVAQERAEGRHVAMVGDGINDAPVLAAADVSAAMGHAALVAKQSADAVMVSGRLDSLLDLQQTARRSLALVRQNLIWAAVYNAACIPLAVLGWLPPWAAGLGMASSSLFVVLNAQRAARAPRPVSGI